MARDMLHDRAVLRLEIGDQRLRPAPVNEGLRPRDAADALVDFASGVVASGGTRQFEPQTALGHRIALADLDQQGGQTLRPESFKILRVEGSGQGHDDPLPCDGAQINVAQKAKAAHPAARRRLAGQV